MQKFACYQLISAFTVSCEGAYVYLDIEIRKTLPKLEALRLISWNLTSCTKK